MSSPLLAVPQVAPICFPAGYDPIEIARPFHDSRWRQTDGRGRPVWTADGAAYRRRMTAHSPIHFALTYLGPYLTDQETGQISFAQAHLAIAEIIAEAARPGPSRHGFVGSRRLGKSTWLSFIGPLFLIAHGYRKFFHLFSLTDPQAAGKYARIVDLLHGRGSAGRQCAPLLLADFPHLRPIKGAGGPGRTVLEGGATIGGRGMGANTLGETGEGMTRPDVICIDDPQPKESRNTPDIVAKVKSDIRTVIMPMNDRAAIWVTGTVTMPGDLMDDIVREARREPCRSPDQGAWVRAGRINQHYYPADWAQRWPPERLARERAADLHSYALEYEPHLLGTVATGRRFTRGMWRRNERFPTARRIISIDHATERGPKNDMTAIALMGVDQMGAANLGRGRVVIEQVVLGHFELHEIRNIIFDLCEIPGQRVRPDLVLWERNQGGRMLSDQLWPLPASCACAVPGETRPGLWPWRAEARKQARIEAFHAQVQREAVWLAGELPAFEGQAEAWSPEATRDDALDAVGAGERYLRTGDPSM